MSAGGTIFGMSKTTISSILTGLIATIGGVLAYQIPMTLLTPQVSHVWLIVTVVGQIITIVLKVWVGVLQNDANAPPPAL
jgi:hypothetical protein